MSTFWLSEITFRNESLLKGIFTIVWRDSSANFKGILVWRDFLKEFRYKVIPLRRGISKGYIPKGYCMKGIFLTSHSFNHRVYDDRCTKLSDKHPKSQGPLLDSTKRKKRIRRWTILSGWQKGCWFLSWALSVFLAMESPFGPFGDSGFTAFFTTSFSSWLSLTW